MNRPRLLDLFCGAGGAAMGYHRAGFDVVGVDIKPQPHYPFEFWQHDAMALLRDPVWWISNFRPTDFDAIHASPPCQAYSVATNGKGFRQGNKGDPHPELIEPTRELLQNVGRPWVMENVEGAPMLRAPSLFGDRTGLVLCGASFGLEAKDHDGSWLVLRRHRLFESSEPIEGRACVCAGYERRGIHIGGVYGGGPENRSNADRHFGGGYTPPQDVRRALMGIDWMTGAELSQAIPPAYTEFIGAQLIRHLAVTT
jgi:DNA (cytosine-5)-methyltransferase 1